MSGRTIRVVGEAELQVAPDSAVLSVELRAEEKSAAKSRAQVDEQVKVVRAALKAAGVDAKDVLVDRLTTGPRSAGLLSYKSGRDDGTGLHRAMSVTVRDLGRYEEVLMALLETGVAKVKGVELQSLAIKHHRGEARTSALLIAREKAQAMAAVMSRKVEDVVTIEERSALIAVTRPRPGFTFGEEPIGDEAWVMGSIAVRAAVEVTFSLS